MVPLKVEETLHDYLRRYFEKVSKGNARQFAKQHDGAKAGTVPDISSSDGSDLEPEPQVEPVRGIAW